MVILHKIDSEITNRCNAGCPLCPRTGDFGAGVSEVVHRAGYRDVEIQTIKNIIDSNSAANLKKFSYCGNYGDPFMHPDIFEIVKMISFYGIAQRFDTNGGMRKPDFWKEVGKLPGVAINFAIDGLKDTNHIYRVKTDFDRIIANAEAFINSGGHADWVFIVFEHNQHQIDEAKELSKKLGFKSFFTKISTRGFNLARGFKTHKKISIPSNKEYQPQELVRGVIEKPVVCKALYYEQFFLTSDNMIMPCCWVHSEVAKKTYGLYRKEDQFYNFLIDNNVKYDLDKYEFHEIVDSYRSNLKILKNYWNNRTIPICNRICGSNRGNKTIGKN